ncbi:SMC-Scp complex subunit ScpB [Alienimonas sp. DA493]|uniref:SMC-Scp complex subunit ScpB n=1 Tax=Alienimonas sp. DA493 TaxID=3373605 RepID=UPI003753F6FB
MADDPATDDPHLLPFPAGGDGEAAGSDDWEESDDDTLSFGEGEDLETAYRRALAAVDEAGPTLAPEPPPTADRTTDEPGEGAPDDAPAAEPGAAAAAAPGERPASDPPARVTPREVVEAALFVGGAGLTAERASKLLRSTFTDADLAAAVAQLNRRYELEGRPYRARAGEDGYHLRLLPEYEPLRRRLYGLGPREVTLPPDVLETLSVVAYRQPITAADVERTRDKPSGGALRRLVRLGVLRIVKPEPQGDGAEAGAGAREKAEPTYATTDRFLDLFGLGSLDDLPVPADLRFK